MKKCAYKNIVISSIPNSREIKNNLSLENLYRQAQERTSLTNASKSQLKIYTISLTVRERCCYKTVDPGTPAP